METENQQQQVSPLENFLNELGFDVVYKSAVTLQRMASTYTCERMLIRLYTLINLRGMLGICHVHSINFIR